MQYSWDGYPEWILLNSADPPEDYRRGMAAVSYIKGGTLAGLVDLRPFEVSRKHFSDDNKRCLFNPFALDPFGKL